MFALFNNILFVNPFILSALAALPILWFLLRVTPPAPKTVDFPATRFLEGLIPDNVTPSKTPWWLLLLRLIIAALVIFALAQPIYNPSESLSGTQDIRLVINDDWASAQNFDQITNTAADILAQAARNKTSIEFITTAQKPDTPGVKSDLIKILSAAEALSQLKALQPKPWGNDYVTLTTSIRDQNTDQDITTIFLSSGLSDPALNTFLQQLRRRGPVTFIQVADKDLPVALNSAGNTGNDLRASIMLPSGLPNGITLSVQARTQDGRILGAEKIQSDSEKQLQEVSFDIPDLLMNEIGQFSIAGRPSAASTYLLDERFRKRSVGIAAEHNNTDPAAKLTESSTYIKNALAPYTQLEFGTITDLLNADPSMIILPDIGAVPSDTLNALEEWVHEGGLLLRFAGPKMTQSLNKPYLVPVPLRTSGRSLDGALSWEKPLKISSFPESSPFYGMDIPDDVIIKQQVLAEPTQDLSDKTWGTLDDGTPLVTASQHGKGLLVLIHTTASPDWSNLSLSGLFVRMLRRLVSLSGKSPSEAFAQNTTLDPLYVLDGFGSLKQADASVKPISTADLDSIKISASHPPGIYGRGGIQKVLNLGVTLESIETIKSLPVGVIVKEYGQDYELDLRPFLLYAALTLLIIDWLVIISLSLGIGALFYKRSYGHRMRASFLILALMSGYAITTATQPAYAQQQRQIKNTIQAPLTDLGADDLAYADDLYLAYIKSGDAEVDSITEDGLGVMARVLARRTSAEPIGVAALKPSSKILPFFPLLYWPIATNSASLSTEEVQNIQHYLDHGGTILFDTRDQNYTVGRVGGTPNAEALRTLVANLNIPPLQALPKDHVLTKSFYLLNDFPGQYSGGTLWVENDSANGRDGVSSVLIGSHNWAASWASNASNTRRTIYGKTRQDELALRFGVNLMMYALTGNYKADQVHVPYILERLGE